MSPAVWYLCVANMHFDRTGEKSVFNRLPCDIMAEQANILAWGISHQISADIWGVERYPPYHRPAKFI